MRCTHIVCWSFFTHKVTCYVFGKKISRDWCNRIYSCINSRSNIFPLNIKSPTVILQSPCNKFSSWKYTKENKKDQHLKTNLNKNTYEKPLFLVTPWGLICLHTLGITIMSLSESVCLMSVFDQHDVSISLQRLLQSSMTGPVWALMVPVVHDCDLTIIPNSNRLFLFEFTLFCLFQLHLPSNI